MSRDLEQKIFGYHAHIYYEQETKSAAAAIRKQLDEMFEVALGRWHDRPVGPHPIAMYQVAFATKEFDKIVPWLMLNRQGLDILVHPETGHDLEDHRDHALWLGEKLKLNLEMFEKA